MICPCRRPRARLSSSRARRPAPNIRKARRTPIASFGNLNWLGTDDQGRDVVARLIYGFRISVLFGLILTLLSSIIGVAAGAVQGYFGGWTDLLFQRFIDIWTSMPTLYLLIILAAFITPTFWILLFILAAVLMDGAGRAWCAPNSCGPAISNMCARRGRSG